jgi:hypothetical protein
VRPGRHEVAHCPPEHAVAPVHAFPHLPQLFGSTLVGMHIPPQNDWYGGHWQVPPTQDWPPGQVVVQLPPPLLDPPLELVPPDPPDPLEPPDPPPLPLPLPPGLFPLDDWLPHEAASAVVATRARKQSSERRMIASD